MKKLLVAVLWFIATTSSALDIKGLEVNKPADCKAIVALILPPERPDPLGACEKGLSYSIETTYVNQPTRMFLRINEAGVLEGVSLIVNVTYEHALSLLTAKWGRPNKNDSGIFEYDDVRLANKAATWTDGDVVLILKSVGRVVTLNLTTKKSLATRAAKQAAETAAANKDI